MFEVLNDQCACVLLTVRHHRPLNVEIHKRAQSDVDVTAGHIRWREKEEKGFVPRFEINKSELVHTDTWRIVKCEKSTSNWLTNCLPSRRLTNKLTGISIWSVALSAILYTLDMRHPLTKLLYTLAMFHPHSVSTKRNNTIISLYTAVYYRNINRYIFRQYDPTITRLHVYFIYIY
jgi:hypothetical protein